MRNRLYILVALLVSMSGACATEETPRVGPSGSTTSPATQANAPGSPAAVPEGAPPSALPPSADAPAPGEAPAVAAPTAAQPTPRSMEEVGAAIETAIAAAAAVPANGEDRCGISYRGLQAMLVALAQAMPDQPTNPLPARDRFLEVCREMPSEVQQCLVVSYAMEHQEQCQAASENLDPAVRARLDAMMNSGAPVAPTAP